MPKLSNTYHDDLGIQKRKSEKLWYDVPLSVCSGNLQSMVYGAVKHWQLRRTKKQETRFGKWLYWFLLTSAQISLCQLFNLTRLESHYTISLFQQVGTITTMDIWDMFFQFLTNWREAYPTGRKGRRNDSTMVQNVFRSPLILQDIWEVGVVNNILVLPTCELLTVSSRQTSNYLRTPTNQSATATSLYTKKSFISRCQTDLRVSQYYSDVLRSVTHWRQPIQQENLSSLNPLNQLRSI